MHGDPKRPCACRLTVSDLWLTVAHIAVALDKESTVVVEIHSGEVDLRDARVVLVSEQEDVHYKMESASCKDAGECTCTSQPALY